MCDIKDCFLIETGYWVDKKKHIFKRNIIVPKLCKNMLREQRNNTGIFATAYCYDIEDQDKANLYGDFYLDFDSTDFELVRKDVIKAISYLKVVFRLPDVEKVCKIFFSGNKGAHIIVPAELLGITPSNDLNEVFKTIAEAIYEFTEHKTLDLRIYDKKRMFRMPNSKHESTGLHKVYLTVDEMKELSYDNIKEIAKFQREIPETEHVYCKEAATMFNFFRERSQKRLLEFNNVKSNGTLKYTPPCIKAILEDGAMNGKRNNTIAILASFYKASGKDLKTTIEELSEWNEERNAMPTPQAELNRTVRSMFTRENCFGCSAIKSLELCSDEKCRFRKDK